MKAETKVVSLETAKRLRDSNFPQDTERWWWGDSLLRRENVAVSAGNVVAAPDAQEIGELLPAHFVIEKFNSPSGSWWCMEKAEAVCEGHENEAEARAAAWLWLKENKLI